jgi:hypothetical protein
MIANGLPFLDGNGWIGFKGRSLSDIDQFDLDRHHIFLKLKVVRNIVLLFSIAVILASGRRRLTRSSRCCGPRWGWSFQLLLLQSPRRGPRMTRRLCRLRWPQGRFERTLVTRRHILRRGKVRGRSPHGFFVAQGVCRGGGIDLRRSIIVVFILRIGATIDGRRRFLGLFYDSPTIVAIATQHHGSFSLSLFCIQYLLAVEM